MEEFCCKLAIFIGAEAFSDNTPWRNIRIRRNRCGEGMETGGSDALPFTLAWFSSFVPLWLAGGLLFVSLAAGRAAVLNVCGCIIC